MTTETRLVCSVEQAKDLVAQLQEAIKGAKAGELSWVRSVLEQSTDPGPWRLIIGVSPED